MRHNRHTVALLAAVAAVVALAAPASARPVAHVGIGRTTTVRPLVTDRYQVQPVHCDHLAGEPWSNGSGVENVTGDLRMYANVQFDTVTRKLRVESPFTLYNNYSHTVKISQLRLYAGQNDPGGNLLMGNSVDWFYVPIGHNFYQREDEVHAADGSSFANAITNNTTTVIGAWQPNTNFPWLLLSADPYIVATYTMPGLITPSSWPCVINLSVWAQKLP